MVQPGWTAASPYHSLTVADQCVGVLLALAPALTSSGASFCPVAAASLYLLAGVVAPYSKKLARDRIALLRHGSRVRPPLPHGGTMRVTGLAALTVAAKQAPLCFSPAPPGAGLKAGGASAPAVGALLF